MRRRTRVVCLQDGFRSSSVRKLTLLLAPVLLSIPANQALGQGNGTTFVSPPVTPHIFNGNLATLPKAPPSNASAPLRRIIPGAPIAPPRPP